MIAEGSPLPDLVERVAALWQVTPHELLATRGCGRAALARQDAMLLMQIATRASNRGLAKRFERSVHLVHSDIHAAIARSRANDRHGAALFGILVLIGHGRPMEVPNGPEPDRPSADVGGAAALPAAPPPPSRPARPRLSLNYRQPA